MKPSIAFVALGSSQGIFTYPPILEETETIEQLNSTKNHALARLGEFDINILDPFKGVVINLDDAARVISSLRTQNFDALVIALLSYAQEDVPCAIASEFADCPKLVWGVLDPPVLDSVSGVLSTSTNLSRMGIRYDYLIGSCSDSSVAKKILAFARAAGTVKRLRETRIGILGYPPPGMMDVSYGEAELKRLGPTIVHLDLQDLLGRLDRASDKDVLDIVEDVTKRVRVDSELSRKDLEDAVRMYLALKQVTHAHKLDGVAVRCFPELFERKTPICFAFSRIADDGIQASCESDISVALTQIALNLLSGKPVVSMDIGPISYGENTIFTLHCGAAPLSLAEDLRQVRLSRHMIARSGIAVDMELRQGRVTLAKLAGPVAGEFKMVIAKGEVIQSQFTEPARNGQFATIRLDAPVKRVVDVFIKTSAGHHIAIGQGDISEELVELCNMMRIEAVSI